MTHPVIGTWDVSLKTPVGTLRATYVFHDTDGVPTGTASSATETVALVAVTCADARVTWRQSVTRPMRLHLDFDVVVDGDTLAGHSRAGRLPRTVVTGTRRPPAQVTRPAR
ncbi:hypothetical protein [Micromonospora sp. HUAS LYJ1]|uniref:hypothetical protein n=1 Tax=Micromonospora sp. HUAS LYJ1 TaxID=3061626 RepID=UPI0026733900|nr:hypothetical protein [Micromonospora sp. HUAS LYJ1]WKU06427.1 hypothetical protein Q2K16_04970 [Micromonospora sp. HUAS LYJ1]